jgi:hypothetical protein
MAHLLAALLSAGPHSFLSHRTVGGGVGSRTINLHRVELTIPGTGGRRRAGLTVHRTQTEPHPDDVRSHKELRVSSVPRLLVELARDPAGARPAGDGRGPEALRLDTRHGRRALEAALQRHEGFPGMTRLRPVLAAYRRTEDHKSMLELAFDEFLGRHPEIPSPARNIHIDGWEIDRCWPERRLVVELDGRPYHVAAQDMEKDRIKDAALQRLGYSPIRFTDFRFEHDLPGILQDLHHFLGLG